MSFQTCIRLLAPFAVLLSSCATVSQTAKPSNKTNLEANTDKFFCEDGSVVTTLQQCGFYDPIIPMCYEPNVSLYYKVNSEDPTDLTFDNLNIETLLNQSDEKWQGMSTCKPISVKIIGHADAVFGNEANIISQRSADIVTKAFLENETFKGIVSTEYKGAEEPLVTTKSPLAEEFNNRVEIMVEFELTQ